MTLSLMHENRLRHMLHIMNKPGATVTELETEYARVLKVFEYSPSHPTPWVLKADMEMMGQAGTLMHRRDDDLQTVFWVPGPHNFERAEAVARAWEMPWMVHEWPGLFMDGRQLDATTRKEVTEMLALEKVEFSIVDRRFTPLVKFK